MTMKLIKQQYTWRKLSKPTSCFAKSRSSCEGSAPGVVMNNIGSFESVSVSCTFFKFRVSGESVSIPIALHTNKCTFLKKRHGLVHKKNKQ